MKIIIFIYLLTFLNMCEKAPLEIRSKIYSPDSSKVLITYYYDYGALGQSQYHTSIINRDENLPETGNFIEESFPPKMEWISNDTIKINCGGPSFKKLKQWAKPKYKNITLTYFYNNPPYKLHKKYFFSNYKVTNDSTITFQPGLWNFIYYMESDQDYNFPIKSLLINYTDDKIENIQIKDDIIFTKIESITEGRNIEVSYIPKFELIPSNLSDDEINELKRLIKKRT